MTSSTGTSGLICVGSPPSSSIASRIAARSTIAGTPVKSCISTRLGVNAISIVAARRVPGGERLDVLARSPPGRPRCAAGSRAGPSARTAAAPTSKRSCSASSRKISSGARRARACRGRRRSRDAVRSSLGPPVPYGPASGRRPTLGSAYLAPGPTGSDDAKQRPGEHGQPTPRRRVSVDPHDTCPVAAPVVPAPRTTEPMTSSGSGSSTVEPSPLPTSASVCR